MPQVAITPTPRRTRTGANADTPPDDGGRKAAIADIVTRYGRGDSIRKIAAETGRSYGNVHRILVDANVTLRPRGGTPQPPLTTAQARTVVIRYAQRRQSIKMIAAETGWSLKAVRGALADAKVRLRPYRRDS